MSEDEERLIIAALYPALLGRDPDPDGSRYFMRMLHEQGLPTGLAAVLHHMIGSQEHRQHSQLSQHSGLIYEAAAFLAERTDPKIQYESGEPSQHRPAWRLCTAKQLRDPAAEFWRAARRAPPGMHRKSWEWDYILQNLCSFGMLRPPCKGLGFAVGREPLAAVMAARGCTIVATDAPPALAALGGWAQTAQHANRLDDLNGEALCDPDGFRERVRFRHVDMNDIPADLAGFDFLWSSCAFEHLGSLEHGMRFVERAMDCLRPGGVAVHTTEFNLSSNRLTFEGLPTSVYRKCDIEQLYVRLQDAGHQLFPLNLAVGGEPEDLHVDTPPYFRAIPYGGSEPASLKLLTQDRNLRIIVTSLGIVVQRKIA